MSRWTAPVSALAGTLSRSAVREIENRTPVPLASSDIGGRWWAGGTSAIEMRIYLEVYSTDAVINPIVSRLAEALSSLEWKLWTKAASQEDRTAVTSSAVLDLLEHPNDFQTFAHIIEAADQHFELAGEANIVLGFMPGVKLPLDMWVLRPDRIEPVASATNFLDGWIYTAPGTGEKIPLETRELMRFLRPDPMNPYRGKSPIPALLRDVGANTAMQEWRAQFFENSARPGGVVTVEKRLSDPEFDEMRERWAEQHKGVSKAHRVAILEQGAKWTDTAFSLKEMQIAELDNAARDKALVAYGMPKGMLGIVEDVNRANAEAGEYLYSRWMVRPRAERIKAMLNGQLLPLYGDRVVRTQELDYENPVPADRALDLQELDTKARVLVELVGQGADAAEVLDMLDWPDLKIEKPEPAMVRVPSQVGQPQPAIEPANPADVFKLSPRVTASDFHVHTPEMAMRWKVVGHPDDNCCDPCKGKIGTLYRSRSSAYADYPGGRGYIKCVGAQYGNKCRCSVIKRRNGR